MTKAMLAIQKKYWSAKNKLNELKNDESGMETLEVVILIVIAVIVAMLVLNFLTGSDGNGGIVSQLFQGIADRLKALFDAGSSTGISIITNNPAAGEAGAAATP